MKSKKGLELSITMLVLIIISIIIFIGAVALTWKFFAGAEEIKTTIEQNTQKQIESLLRQGTDITAIPINSKKANVGQELTFGLGVRNILGADAGFSVVIGFSDIYNQRGQRLTDLDPQFIADPQYIEAQWLGQFKQQDQIMIKNNKFEIIPLRVRLYSRTAQGQRTPKGAILAFNVCVFDSELYTECIDQTPPETIYGKKIRQIFVETT